MTDVPPESNSTAEIQAATARLVADDRAARAMGERARALMLSVLTPDRVLEYWYRVIKQHTELQRFHPRCAGPCAVPAGGGAGAMLGSDHKARCEPVLAGAMPA